MSIFNIFKREQKPAGKPITFDNDKPKTILTVVGDMWNGVIDTRCYRKQNKCTWVMSKSTYVILYLEQQKNYNYYPYTDYAHVCVLPNGGPVAPLIMGQDVRFEDVDTVSVEFPDGTVIKSKSRFDHSAQAKEYADWDYDGIVANERAIAEAAELQTNKRSETLGDFLGTKPVKIPEQRASFKEINKRMCVIDRNWL